MSVAEKAVVYAALILADDGVDITADKLQALTKAAGVEVEPVWANLFSKALEGKNIGELLMNIGTPGAGAPAGGGGGGAVAGGAAAEEKKEEEKPAEAEKEESDEDMGFGLFD
ncbi:hypothetical protein RclHR1_00150023 [Rhizophagus clarus]|nr:hypothetical protein RclHR1_00150023 [Rhizophagus clarus]